MKNALDDAPWLYALARVFSKPGEALYIVGGAVRNPLMGLSISDVDVCGPLRPEAVCALCEGTEVTARLRAAHFGTVELHVTDPTGARHMAEYTTFREDSYRCGHKPEGVRFTTELSVDALRRDFSVNALYRQVTLDGLKEIVDPTGGLSHLEQGILHTVTANPDQVLKDDGLRILRAVRFQAELSLTPTEALLNSLRKYAPLLGEIAKERIRDELQKVLLADLRYPTLHRSKPAAASGLHTLYQIGAWPWVMGKTTYDAQAVDAMGALPQIDGVSPLSLRMALLCRQTAPVSVEQEMLGLRFSALEARQTAQLLEAIANLLGEQDIVRAAKAGLCAMIGSEALLYALGQKQAADCGLALRKRLIDKNLPLTLRELAVNGNDLRPVLEKRSLPVASTGQLLRWLWESILRGELPNQRTALLAAALQVSPSSISGSAKKGTIKP